MVIHFLLTLTILLTQNLYATSNEFMLHNLLTHEVVLENGKVLPKDKYMGDINAPVMMIEYASFSCIHCATFSKQILPKIKKDYIDTGKVLFIFRDFPLNAEAFKASQVAQCYISQKHCVDSDNNCKERNYFNIYHALFNSLNHWANPNNTIDKLKEVLEIGQINLDKCLADKSIQEQLLNTKIYAIRNLGISSAPAFFINGKNYTGINNFTFFAQALDTAIENSKG